MNRFYGLFRYSHSADFKPVQKEGQPVPYKSACEAKCGAYEVILDSLQPAMRSSGVMASKARQEAEKVFK